MNHKTVLIGMGVMGQRMLRNMLRYDGFSPLAYWDPSPITMAKLRHDYPNVQAMNSAQEALATAGAEVTYIACPPNFHHEYASAAFELRQAVFCEKPLGVDLQTSRTLCETARHAGQINIVNYSLASAPAATELCRLVNEDALGDILGADLRLHFSQWPEDWQVDAAQWLDYPEQGGFVREVVSHWVYLSQRLFGPAQLEHTWLRYPTNGRSETHMHGALSTATTPITIAASVGGAGPDLFEYTVWGSRSSARILDWNRLQTTQGDCWVPQLTHLDDPREEGYRLQLANAASAIANQDHTMPNFDDALSVQILIEAMLTSQYPT